MREYELMLVLDPNLDESGVEAATNRVTSVATGRGGEVVSIEAWGRRRLAYPIGRNRDGIYMLARLRMDAGTAGALENAIRLMEPVIRHLQVRPEPTAKAPVAA